MTRFVVSLVFVAALLPLARAQHGSDTPFLAALRYVPSGVLLQDDRAQIEFADIAAAMQLRGLQAPASWQQMQAEYNPNQVLLSLPPSLPPSMTMYIMAGGPDYSQVLGFELFDITSTVSFGQPPTNVTVLVGNLDDPTVVAAFEARGYELEPYMFGSSFLCPDTGCHTGAASNMADRNMANVFGGDLGRRFPVWLHENAIVGSASEVAVRVIAETYIDEHFSVADVDEVRAINAALYQYPHVVAAWLVHPTALMFADTPPVGSTPESASQYWLAIHEALDANPLPGYLAAGFAAVGNDTHEFGLVTLVYPDQATAEFAAAALGPRLEQFESSRSGGTYADLFSSYGQVVEPTAIEHDQTGLWVVTVGITAPIPFEPDSSGRHVMTGTPYLRLVSMFINRDTLWLVPTF